MLLIIINIRKTKESELSVIIRILTNYLQLISTSMTFDVSFPSSMTDIFLPINRIGSSSDTFLSFDCFITDYTIKGPFPSNAFFKLFLTDLLPLILICIVSSIWVVVYFIKRKWVRSLKKYIVVSFVSILFFLHPKLTESSLGIFR
jgi:hypothetical protein